MTRVLLVDAGGVLFNNITEETDFVRRLADQHGADPDLLRQQIDGRDYDYEVDARHVYEVLGDCLAGAGAARLTVDYAWIDALYLDCLRPHWAMLDHLRWLRTADHRLLLTLANNEASHFDRLKHRRYGHLDLFDVIGSSWRLEAVKPDREYFDRLLLASSCDPADALLIDDNPEVVAAAEAYGIPTMHVTDPAAVPERLGSLLAGSS